MIEVLQLDEENEAEWADPMEAFEASFTYPLGEGRTFRISHGRDYGRFYRSMGAGRTIVAAQADQVLGAVSGVSRTIRLPGGTTATVYLGDLKIHEDALSGRVLLNLLRSLQEQFNGHRVGFGVVMRGTNVVPSKYTGRLGIPAFEKVGEVSILRIPTNGAAIDDAMTVGLEEMGKTFASLTANDIAVPPGDASCRARFEPQPLCAAAYDACGLLEDTLLAKRLFDSDGVEMLSAHLSAFAFASPEAGARLLRSAIRRAYERRLPALFVAVPSRRTDELLEKLDLAATTRTLADIYGHGLPANHDWYVNTAEI